MIISSKALSAAVESLSGKDREFALSLLDSWEKYGSLSEKQSLWAGKLIMRAEGAAAAPAPKAIDLSPIVQLFQNRLAAGGKKWPALLFATAAGDTLRLSLAGQAARFPGSLNVTSPGGYGSNTWFGRIHTDGRLELSGKADPGIADALAAFAADPAGQATAFGKETGNCCFCGIELTHGNSIKLGYGPICADKWGLFHTYNKAELKAEAVEAPSAPAAAGWPEGSEDDMGVIG